jgi:hypothetical protein
MSTEIKTLTQEFEQILSSKVDTKIEEAGYTKNVEEWIEFIENSKTDPLAPNEYICDYTIVKNAKAFAVGPVFSYMGKVHACSTARYTSLADLKNSLKGKKYILYYIFINLKTCNFENFEPEILEKPEIQYTFRGHILNDT